MLSSQPLCPTPLTSALPPPPPPLSSFIRTDLGVTPIIQCGVSMLITSALVHTDIHHSTIAPFPFVYPHVEELPNPQAVFNRSARDIEKQETEKRGARFWLGALVRFVFEGTEQNVVVGAGFRAFWRRALWSFVQGV